ncbi:3830_t:CDS:1 [Diversispora eburnea]|uniref:Dihydrofolate synthetase n=1 Tax=Diversispora eburnea TaxID=1213867 RepID=A0A9N8UYE5_9GLOM|nr:3830_t:CDS:1 [Diversispora eburnea]
MSQISFKLNLDKIKVLLKHLNNPHHRLSAIHISGTNGKGSTSAYIDSILLKTNFKTGRLNTPHLLEPRDSIKINDESITREDYRRTYNFISTINSNNNINASLYEKLVATAYWWFDAQNVDVSIVEVGIGGRLDATNVFEKPLISVITSIGMDHETFLGNSIEAISKEKAGIIKSGCKVVIAPQIEEASLNTLKTCIKEVGCSHSIFVTPAKWNPQKKGLASLKLLDGTLIEFYIPLGGDYQLDNATTAITVIDLLRKTETKFSNITNENIKDGIASTSWPGRLQFVNVSSILNRPVTNVTKQLLVDGAHNPQGAKSLREFVDKLLQDKEFAKVPKVHWIYAASKEKNVLKCLDALVKDGDTLIAVEFSKVEDMPWVNCCKKEEIVLLVKKLNRKSDINIAENLVEAIKQAYDKSEKEDGMIVLCGSLYLIADLFRLLV